jgi:hypothetical protein
MSRYDYFHSWAPQGGEGAPRRFIKGEAKGALLEMTSLLGRDSRPEFSVRKPGFESP